jgi:hypothetical protein
LALLENKGLAYKHFPGKNTLAYFSEATVKKNKKFIAMDTWGLYHKTFYGRNLQIFRICWSVFPWQAFPAYSNVCGQGWSLPLVKHLSISLLKGGLLTLPTNIRLGWNGLPSTNTLAFYENP